LLAYLDDDAFVRAQLYAVAQSFGHAVREGRKQHTACEGPGREIRRQGPAAQVQRNQYLRAAELSYEQEKVAVGDDRSVPTRCERRMGASQLDEATVKLVNGCIVASLIQDVYLAE
jgi:hypothetical protein